MTKMQILLPRSRFNPFWREARRLPTVIHPPVHKPKKSKPHHLTKKKANKPIPVPMKNGNRVLMKNFNLFELLKKLPGPLSFLNLQNTPYASKEEAVSEFLLEPG